MAKKPLKDYNSFASSGLPARGPVNLSKIEPYYNNIVAGIKGGLFKTNNACGQAEIATVMTYWGAIKVTPSLQHDKKVEAIYKDPNGKPDIPFGDGSLGTSIEQIRDYLRSKRIRATGYNTERKRIDGIDGKFDWLRDWVDNGYPVIVIVDSGAMFGDTITAHYAVLPILSRWQVD